jgi:tRNA dimethylallyltransferase
MSKKLLIISGPTATGKTDLAIKLAKKFNGELISADSRQVYKGMDIGTGKDHPKNIKVHLVDVVEPDGDFSVAEYRKLALNKIDEIYGRNHLPIIVGGTGLYIDSIFSGNINTFNIKPNRILRLVLNRVSVSILQKIYSFLNEPAYKSLNNSEKHNPHRLIRKIEIGIHNIFHKKKEMVEMENFDVLHFSLTAPNDFLYSKIDKRVESRLKFGLLEEISFLLKKYKWSDPGLNSLAYKEFKSYFNNNQTLEECIATWKFDEHAYARRQKTWFKKQTNVIFVDIAESANNENIIKTAAEWYNKS